MNPQSEHYSVKFIGASRDPKLSRSAPQCSAKVPLKVALFTFPDYQWEDLRFATKSGCFRGVEGLDIAQGALGFDSHTLTACMAGKDPQVSGGVALKETTTIQDIGRP